MTHAQPPRRLRAEPEPDDDADAHATRIDPPVARVLAPRGAPRLAGAMWLVAAFVLVAVIKPWGGGGPVAATLHPELAAPVEVTPVPTQDRSATGLAVAICLGTGAWRIATLETWRGRDVRVWRAIEPAAAAAGPLDPLIPSVPVVADVLSGLGWCAPSFGLEQPVGPALVQAWQVVDGRAQIIALDQVQPTDGVTPIAALYLPAAGPWTTGRVVFQYRDMGTGAVRWLAADLQILSGSAPPASPAAPIVATSPSAP